MTFAAGESLKSFNVFVSDDLTRESTETFNVRLSSPSNAALGTPALATVSIVDNDKRTRGPRGSTTLDDAPLRLKRRKLEVSQNRLLDSDPWHVTSTVFSAFSKSDV